MFIKQITGLANTSQDQYTGAIEVKHNNEHFYMNIQ